MVGMNSKEKIKKKFPTITIVNFILLQVIHNEIGYLMLTRSSTDTINHIHHRQPVLLEEFEISRHLGGEDILNSDANININFHRVSKDVNSTSNNNSSLINTVNVS